MKFSDIPGHEEVKQRLRRMVADNRLPHALLLYGPEGIGKLMMARALASYIHCSSPTADGDSCGRCPSCLQHASHNHVDTHFTFPTLKKKSDDSGYSSDYMEQWRAFLDEEPFADITDWPERLGKANGQPVIYVGEAEALSRDLSYTPRVSDYKVAIVWLPERLQDNAANKLLKLIEEPFADTRLIFVSNNHQEILPTIFSRLQRIEMRRYSDKELMEAMSRYYPAISRTDAANVVPAAEGNVIKVKSMVVEGTNSEMLKEFSSMMRMAFQRKLGDLRRWGDAMAGRGREWTMKYLDYCCRMMRENFINNTGIPDMTRMTAAEQQFCSKFSPFINSRNVLGLIEQFEKAKRDIAANGNAKIVLFDMSLHVILLIK